MKKIFGKFTDVKYALYASISTALLAPSSAFAQGMISMGANLKQQFQWVWNIASWAFMAVGIFYVGTGIARLKAAVDSQGQQVKYSEGIWRIALGSAFLSTEFIINTMIGTVTGTQGTITSPGANLFQ